MKRLALLILAAVLAPCAGLSATAATLAFTAASGANLHEVFVATAANRDWQLYYSTSERRGAYALEVPDPTEPTAYLVRGVHAREEQRAEGHPRIVIAEDFETAESIPLPPVPELDAPLAPPDAPVEVALLLNTVSSTSAAAFPASYDTTCLEDATDGQDDTPSTIAWVADDGGTANAGSFDDPYDYNEELLGLNTSSNANWHNLWDLGVRTVCWKKVTSNYNLMDGTVAATSWNQGPLLNSSPTQGMVNFAYPAAPLNVGSDAAFETTTLISGNAGMMPVSQTSGVARAAGEWYGFRFGELSTTEAAVWYAWGSGEPSDDQTIKVEWNYFASTIEADIAGSPTVGSGNDTSLYLNGSDGATVRYNYFADVDLLNVRANPGAAVVRGFISINWEISNNTFAICPDNSEGGWDATYPKDNNDGIVFSRNLMYSLAGCSAMGISLFQGSGNNKDADIGMWERNVYWNQTTPATGGSAFKSQFGADDQTYRYNLIYGGDRAVTNGDGTETSCNGSNPDEWQNVNAKVDGNIFIDVGERILIWWSHLNNQFLTVNDNAIWFVDDALADYVDESERGGGTYTDCGGATEQTVDANTPTTSGGIANLNGLSYASGNTDSDPKMVCQYIGDNKCNGGTTAAPDDFRFCTGLNTPVTGCPSASPHVDGSGIAQIGPYQGENMNNDPSTYSFQIGATWVPPVSHR